MIFKKALILLLFCTFTSLDCTAINALFKPIVKIVATRNGQTFSGTGFYVSGSSIVTAYHVIYGANALKIYSYGNPAETNVVVDKVYPDLDIAYLTVAESPNSKSDWLKIAAEKPKLGEPLQIFSSPRGGPFQLLQGNITNDEPVWSSTIVDEKGNKIFGKDIKIYLIDASIYTGMSGSPVVSQQGVVGILSGSLNEGGGIGWIIPLSNATRPVVLSATIAQVHKKGWPAFHLMRSNWRSFEMKVEKDVVLSKMVGKNVEYTDSLSNVFKRLTLQANKVNAAYLFLKPSLNEISREQINSDSILAVFDGFIFQQYLQDYGLFAATVDEFSKYMNSLAQNLAEMSEYVHKGKGGHNRLNWQRVFEACMDFQSDWQAYKWPMMVPLTEEGKQKLVQLSRPIQAIQYIKTIDDPRVMVDMMVKGVDAMHEMSSDLGSVDALSWMGGTINYFSRISTTFDEISYR